MLTIKRRPEIEEHVQAGHFNVYPKAWMGSRRIWFWTRPGDETIQGAFPTQREAEDAAVSWWEESQKLKEIGLGE